MRYLLILLVILNACGSEKGANLANNKLVDATLPTETPAISKDECTSPVVAETVTVTPTPAPEMVSVILVYKYGGDYDFNSGYCGFGTPEIKTKMIQVIKDTWVKSNSSLTCVKSFNTSGYTCDYTQMINPSNQASNSHTWHYWKNVVIDENLKESFPIPSEDLSGCH